MAAYRGSQSDEGSIAMNYPNFHRKARIAWLSLKIATLRALMTREAGPTASWKRMARAKVDLLRQRNSLLTPDEIHQIEKRRGLA